MSSNLSYTNTNTGAYAFLLVVEPTRFELMTP